MGASGANEIVFTDRTALRRDTIAMPVMERSIFLVARDSLARVARGPLRGCLASGDLPLTIRQLAHEAGITRTSDANRAVESLVARGLFEWLDHQGRSFLRVVGFAQEQDRCQNRIRAKIRATAPKRAVSSASDVSLQGLRGANMGESHGPADVDNSPIPVDTSSNPVDKGPSEGPKAVVDNFSDCAQQSPPLNGGVVTQQGLKEAKPGDLPITPDDNVNVNVRSTTSDGAEVASSGGAQPGGPNVPGPTASPATRAGHRCGSGRDIAM